MKYILTIGEIDQLSNLEATKKNIYGVRINLCKYNVNELYQKLDEILLYHKIHKPQVKLFLDLPFPHNKTRIIKYNMPSNQIESGIYNITDNIEIYNRTNNCILLSSITELNKSELVYYGDGRGAFKIIEKDNNLFTVEALNEFIIWKSKSISIGYSDQREIVLKMMWDLFKEYKNISEIHFLLSFVDNENDILNFRSNLPCQIIIYSKIETPSSLFNINNITKNSDGLVLARGDLAILNNYNNLNEYTKVVISAAENFKKEIYAATDIMISMYDYYLPRRSDIIDVTYMAQLGFTNFIFKKNMKNIDRTVDVINNIVSGAL